MELYFRSGLANSTQKSYASGKRRYIQFCHSNNFPPLPTSELLLSRFISALANEKLSHRTIKCYLSAVRHLHVAENHGDPGISGMVRLEQVMRGIKSTQARGGIKGAVRLPVTLEILRKLKAVWTESEPHRDGVMLWAAAALCFFAFLRAREMTVPSDTAYDQGAISALRMWQQTLWKGQK